VIVETLLVAAAFAKLDPPPPPPAAQPLAPPPGTTVVPQNAPAVAVRGVAARPGLTVGLEPLLGL